MKSERIINLCDRDFDRVEEYYDKYADRNAIIAVGSYSCPNYFIELINRELVNQEFDLVVPIFPEHLISFLEKESFAVMCEKAKTIVVNDIGLLSLMNRRSFFNVRLGRLFFKEYKDHRYKEYHNNVYETKIDETIRFLKKSGMSFEAAETDLPTLHSQIETDCRVYVHLPYRQVSLTHICEFSSVGKPIVKKFIPDDVCCFQCLKQHLYYPETGYIKVGRSVYDEIDVDMSQIQKFNIIETPGWQL